MRLAKYFIKGQIIGSSYAEDDDVLCFGLIIGIPYQRKACQLRFSRLTIFVSGVAMEICELFQFIF